MTTPPSGARIVCLLGMHRSGTSLVTRLVNAMGVDLGPGEHLMKATGENPRGFWEHHAMRDLNDEILSRFGGTWHEPPVLPAGWESDARLADVRRRARAVIRDEFSGRRAWGWKDPRTCLTLPFWQQLLPPMRYVICLRNPLDVARSLEKRDRFPVEKSGALWLLYLRSSLAHTTGLPRLFTFYDDLVTDWPAEVRRLSRFVWDRAVDEEPGVRDAVNDVLEKDLQHHRASTVEVSGDPQLAFPPKAVYLVMRGYRFADDGAGHALDLFVAHAQRELEHTRNLQALDQLTDELTVRLHVMERTLGWKVLRRLRRAVERWLPAGSRRRRGYRVARRIIEVLADEGIRGVLRRSAHKLRARSGGGDLRG